MNIQKDNAYLIFTSSIRDKLIFIIPLLIGIWFIVTFFYGIWYSSILIGQAAIANPYSFILWINILFAIVSYGFFGPISFLITMSSISSLSKSKKITVSRSEINLDTIKYFIFDKNIRLNISEIIELKTQQDENSDFCQLLAILKTGKLVEIEHDHGLMGMSNLNNISQEIHNFLNEKNANSFKIKLTQAEFIPYIEDEEEEEIKENKDK